MTFHETLSIAIGIANLAVVVAIIVHLRRVALRPPAPLVAILVVFAIRATIRLIPPLGEEPEWLLLSLDLALLVVLLMFLATAQRLVGSFVYERDAMQRAQIDYDDALLRHETNVADRQRDLLDRLDREIMHLHDANGSEDRDEAARAARATVGELRGE